MNDNRKPTVLLIEDEDITRKSVSFYLGSKGFGIIEAKNGRMGLEKFRERGMDLVLLDLRMPEMDGLEVLPVVTDESPETPVIVMSGTDKISDAVEALRFGAWDYVSKPIRDMSVLLHVIHKALERARLLRENREYQERLEAQVEERTRELMLEIKERKRAEEAVRENEKAYRAIFNASTDAMFIIDRERGALLEANSMAGKWYGYGREEFMGLSPRDLILPEDRYKYDLLLEDVKARGSAQFEFQALRKDGTTAINEGVGTEVVYKGQDHLLAVFRDITERKHAEEKERLQQQQLIQADKMASLGVLVSGVAHEINNPNNFIMVNAPILTRIWKNVDPILQEYHRSHGDFYIAPRVTYSEMKESIPGIISGIMEGAQRINNFVKELKSFSRPTLSTIDERVDINKVMHAAVTLLSNLIERSSYRFSTAYGTGIPEVRGNFQRLEQVMINLIENSCQALPSPDRGLSISTGFDPEKKMVKVQVADEGNGMTPEIIDKIKSPFFTTKRDQGGTGLGLSISSKIIEDHHGTIEFNSTPGEGTVVTVLLPVSPEPSERNSGRNGG